MVCKVLFVKKISGLFAAVGFTCLVFGQSANAVPGVLPPQSAMTTTTSSRDAYAKQQTILYATTISKPGRLTHVVMSLPAGATGTNLRSTSGTVAPYKTGQIIWRPASPINVVKGTKISLPIFGINYYQPGTTSLSLVASDAVGEVLTYARSNFILNNPSIGCQPTGSNYIQTENTKAGAPKASWQIDQAKFAPTIFSAYASAESYKCGDIAYFKVDSQQSSLATAKVYRMGYYGGTGAREVWSTTDYFLSGKQTPARIVNQTSPVIQRMVDASHWKNNIGIRIDGRFTPGTYLIKMTDRVGHETYVPFTVRDETGVKHEYLFQQATTTWQAYNNYGGYSFYKGTGGGSSHLSFNRPYTEAAGKGSGQYLQLENGLVYWMEKHGYDVTYWTDTDLHANPAALSARAKTLILPAHDEYYSTTMRNAVINGLNTTGVNLISLGANQIHRPIAYGAGNRTFEVEGKISGGYPATTFRSRGPAMAEQNITGSQYGCRSHGTVTTNNAWIWNGIPAGTVLEGFANGETDYVNTTDYLNGYTVPVPTGNTLIMSSPLQSCAIPQEPLRMDIVARTTPAGTRVYAGATFAYACFLDNSCYPNWPGRTAGAFSVDAADSATVDRMLQNVFRWVQTGLTN